MRSILANLLRVVGAVLFLLPSGATGVETVRVITWDLKPGIFTPDAVVEAAKTLKALEPDIIILGEVPGWEACRHLITALGSDRYSVQVCSAFRHGANSRQTAIISKQRAYFSWSEPWPEGQGGYAFAAIAFEGRRLGIYSVQSDSADLARWRMATERFKSWTANRVEAVVALCSGSAVVTAPNEIGALFGKSAWVPALKSHGFTARLAPDPVEPPAALFIGVPQVCDLHFQVDTPLAVESSGLVPGLMPASTPYVMLSLVLAAVSGAVFLFLFIVWRARARRTALTAPSVQWLGTGTDVSYALPPFSTGGESNDRSMSVQFPLPPGLETEISSGARTSIWQLLWRKVFYDRRALMQGQHQATEKVDAVNERLARIEQQLQEYTIAYEARIAQLTQELEDARDENRAMIVARINQAKAEMAAARAKAMSDLKGWSG